MYIYIGKCCEAHALDINNIDLYGKMITIISIKKIRDDIPFSNFSIEECKEQIKQDINNTIKYFIQLESAQNE